MALPNELSDAKRALLEQRLRGTAPAAERAGAPEVKEVLLALNATVEGQSTAHYLTDQLAGCNVTVSRLAHGVPIGGELDYLDEGTLAAAVKARKTM